VASRTRTLNYNDLALSLPQAGALKPSGSTQHFHPAPSILLVDVFQRGSAGRGTEEAWTARWNAALARLSTWGHGFDALLLQYHPDKSAVEGCVHRLLQPPRA
jgi:hypothetical protein